MFVRKRRCLRAAIIRQSSACQEFASALKEKLYTSDPIELEKRKLIVQLGLSDLIAKLQKEELLPTDVLHAYQWRALNVSQETGSNCVVQFIEEAESWAAILEETYGQHRKAKPPFYGIPISAKESVQIKGYECTRGYVRSLGHQSVRDSNVIAVMKKLGAIPFARSNVPQTLLSYACSNPIYGRTAHPTHPERTCGGSTGGEATLIRLAGSILGIGGDVGGSIRIPAHFSGICGFKPTSTRMSQIGSTASIPGRPLMCATVGPMARDVYSLVTFMRNILCDDLFGNDPYVMPVKFQEQLYKAKGQLTIGYYETDDFFAAIPACRRVVSKSREMLEAAGHRLVPFIPPDIAAAVRLLIAVCTVDGGQYIKEHLKEEIVDSSVLLMKVLYSLPYWSRRMLASLLNPLDRRSALLLRSFPSDTAELRLMYEKVGTYRRNFYEAWKDAGLDALICPPCPVVALPDKVMPRLMSIVSYPAIYNLLDLPVGVVPCSVVTEDDEKQVASLYSIDGPLSSIIQRHLGQGSGSVGLPVGLQIVAMHARDEVCLRVMTEVEQLWSKLHSN
uniref:fatty acid amide hydrolase n=1 Tax=Trichuris muris TaxID=70415 RepID=A0A5S6QY60_TRIMR